MLLLAGLFSNCQTRQQINSSAFSTHASSNLALVHYASRHATQAVVYTRQNSPLPGEEKEERCQPLTPEELKILKDILSRARKAPFSGKVPMNHWTQADAGIRLYSAGGELIFDLNKYSLASYTDCQRDGSSLLCVSDLDIASLYQLPTITAALKYKTTQDSYARICRTRCSAPQKLKESISQATHAVIRHTNATSTPETIPLGSQDFARLCALLQHALPLPAMSRHAWEKPAPHSVLIPLPPAASRLEFQNEAGQVVYTIPLDSPYIARESELESFRLSEKNGEQFALPDADFDSFYSLLRLQAKQSPQP